MSGVKRIYIRTTSAFFAIYFIIMGITTYVYAVSIKDRMQYIATVYLDELGELVSLISYDQLTGNSNYNTGYIYNKLCMYMQSLANENIYFRATMYDAYDNVIAKSGNVLIFTLDEDIAGEEAPMMEKAIPLDLFMTHSEINELFLSFHSSYIKTPKVTIAGYDNGEYIIPSKIVCTDWDGKYSSEKNFDTNTKERDGLSLIECKLKYGVKIYYESIPNTLMITKKDRERYEVCTKIAEPLLIDLRNGGGSWRSNDMDNILIGSVGGIVSFFHQEPHGRYASFGITYYPLEEALPNLVPLYIIAFITTCIIMLIFLKKQISIYHQQLDLEAARRNLTNAIAHELKTPLGIIRSYCEGILEHINEDKKEHYLEVIIGQTEYMDEMVLDMLDLSRLESGQVKLHKTECSLKEITENLLSRYQRMISDKNLNVTFTASEKNKVECDRKLIEKVISNFISNAVHHTPNSGNIKIVIEQKGHKSKFSIENSGKTIPPDITRNIWDAYYKADDARTHIGGTGLGLSIVKNILTLHGFQYGMYNIVVGVVFWFET